MQQNQRCCRVGDEVDDDDAMASKQSKSYLRILDAIRRKRERKGGDEADGGLFNNKKAGANFETSSVECPVSSTMCKSSTGPKVKCHTLLKLGNWGPKTSTWRSWERISRYLALRTDKYPLRACFVPPGGLYLEGYLLGKLAGADRDLSLTTAAALQLCPISIPARCTTFRYR